MSIWRVDFDLLSQVDLANLIDAQIPEGSYLEYKRDPYGKKDNDKKEALKDITAFANSDGGIIIIGMETENGLPSRLNPLPTSETDALINRLEALIRDGVEPRIVGVRIRAVPVEDGSVIILRIPKSWYPPHRVSTAATNRFYLRNSAGAHEASVEELRVMFTLGADARQRILQFRRDRMAKIMANQAAVTLKSSGRLVLHLAPLAAFFTTTQIDIGNVDKAVNLSLTDASFGSSHYNLDGFVVLSGQDGTDGYVQVFRSGIIEAVTAGFLHDNALRLERIMDWIMRTVQKNMEALRKLDIPPPISVSISFNRISGAILPPKDMFTTNRGGRFFPEIDPVYLPEVTLEDYGTPPQYTKAIRPFLDALWNAADFPNCPYYDQYGRFQPPRS